MRNILFKDPLEDLMEVMDGTFNEGVARIPTNILENEEEFILEFELPGFEKNDIEIDVTDGTLVVEAGNKRELDENLRYLRKDIPRGKYKQKFNIQDIDVEKIEASYKNGILTVLLPKKEKKKTSIEVK